MVSVEWYSPELKVEWNQFVKAAKNGLFMFERDFLEYHADRFQDASLIIRNDGKIAAVLPASRHADEISSHGGLTYGGLVLGSRTRSAEVLDIFREIKAFLGNEGISRVIYKTIPYIFHKQPSDEDLYALFRADATLIRRDISTAINLKNRLKLSKGRKWLINRAKKHDIVVSTNTDWPAFYTLLSEVLEKHNATPTHMLNELLLLAERFPKNIQLATASLEGNLLAGCVLFRFDNVVHTQYIATNEEGKKLGALDYLLENLISDAAATGYQYFNFGISTKEAGRYLNEGLIAQKEGCGGRAVTLDFYSWTL